MLIFAQEENEDDSEAEALDLDEDAEAKAERLGRRMAAGADAQPASASRRPEAASRPRNKRALPSEEVNALGKQKSKKKGKKGLQLNEMADGQTQSRNALQQPGSAAGLAEGEQGAGYEPYRRDILAEVARKQREHLLGAKIGATAAPLHPPSDFLEFWLSLTLSDAHAWLLCTEVN